MTGFRRKSIFTRESPGARIKLRFQSAMLPIRRLEHELRGKAYSQAIEELEILDHAHGGFDAAAVLEGRNGAGLFRQCGE